MAIFNRDLINLIYDRCLAGETLSDVCLDLGLKQSSASRAFGRAGIKLPKHPAISEKKIRQAEELYESGKSQQHIADLLNVSRSTLALKLRDTKTKMRSRYEVSQIKRLDSKKIHETHKQYLETRKTSKIAKELGLTKSGLIENFRFYGLEVKEWRKFNVKFIHKINKQLKSGKNLRDLSKKFDFSVSGFRQAAKKENINIYKKQKVITKKQEKKRAEIKEIESAKNEAFEAQEDIKRSIVDCYYQAYSLKDISDIFSLKKRVVFYILKNEGIKIHSVEAVTEPQLQEIYDRRMNEGVGICTLALEYEINPSSIYERMRKIGLEVRQDMGTTRRIHSDSFVRELYEIAHNQKCSIKQIVTDFGGSSNDNASITRIGRSLGLKPPTSADLSGHEQRIIKLYVLKIRSKNGRTGIYAGCSINPKLRSRQHLQTGKKNFGINKRDAFINEAHVNAKQAGIPLAEWYELEILDEDYCIHTVQSAETSLIKKWKKLCEKKANYELLNGLVGSPVGGYGRKLDSLEESQIVYLYEKGFTSEKIAADFNVGRSTINRIIQRSGAQKIPNQYLARYSDDTRREIIKMYQEGKSKAQIARETKISYSSIHKFIKDSKK